ncbi:MAG: 2'-5' RNA ligase [Candidatus Staskawiczbacteria bacterium RIFOXYD2_FULL_37_9]|uniref:RNA 2',3'-cyclic phosphodiesterase n=1 Tax=Candidatus Staskawiczbacteria bacterium RIFOXYB1_FULL_37_44 TaxID=1802223 RepID=A0A1G2IWZ5_9BACT|nr:MAG: 2'-5' RNA ligase [Candidatus Staskawiczbacteria bacterium RIFOXYB1_FULL_37_44]OGZ83709.1 MAG: 2'-5' RNA ligase [Candidatus Staskawiczbacteria bacterium RIFOXYC1_FULL_37_52]OGZ90233.1 MAG: 2'-5' RNA ligase [Candidatus Staskawiczbacteria bacterium RIFOXYD1_FULL_37_110]OGZ93363.1 MAG: 2'-5' RNA ligase [Candidatus Staskawiczbacteria bacterium RIFOXYD2_FULL_37_9]
MEKRHRIFIAINLPEEIKKELARFYDKWPELPAKWASKDNLHLTLEFLGNLNDVEIGEACQIAGEVAKRHKPFSVNLNKILYGPIKKMPPKFVWAIGESSEALANLKSDLQECLLEKIAFRPEQSRGFTPHITLARILEWEFRKFDLDERPEINENIDLIFSVDAIEVMESEKKRGGHVYTVIESCPLE